MPQPVMSTSLVLKCTYSFVDYITVVIQVIHIHSPDNLANDSICNGDQHVRRVDRIVTTLPRIYDLNGHCAIDSN